MNVAFQRRRVRPGGEPLVAALGCAYAELAAEQCIYTTAGGPSRACSSLDPVDVRSYW